MMSSTLTSSHLATIGKLPLFSIEVFNFAVLFELEFNSAALLKFNVNCKYMILQ